MNSRPICAMGVSHKDTWQAYHWMKWATHLQPDRSVNFPMVMMWSQRAMGAFEILYPDGLKGVPDVHIVECSDQMESGYPASASHLFLRTLEACEELFPGRPVLWCEPDTVPLYPGWFDSIATEYQECGHPFMGQRIMHAGSTGGSHLMGNSVYPANWRALAPRIASVLTAPDVPLWGEGKGQPWDVWAAAETTRDMHETRQIQQIFNCTPWIGENLNRLDRDAQLFHRCKDGTLIAELARRDQPGFAATLAGPQRYFRMNGHPSRAQHLGYRLPNWIALQRPTGWTALMAPTNPLDTMVLLNLCGSKGIDQITAKEFESLTKG